MPKATLKNLDSGQLEMMWSMLKLGGLKASKNDVQALIDSTDFIRQALIQKTAGQAPTIEPEVRHGRWITEKVRKPNWKGVEHDYFQPNSCSVCHTGFAVRTNFCPNCGADMREEGADNG